MNKRTSDLLFFLLSFLLGLCLYWPSFSGTPIWDDISYWFEDPVMKSTFSYLSIWKDFGWPLSVGLQKLLLEIFQDSYVYYHGINYLLHFLNALLVVFLAHECGFKHKKLLFVLFLLHPASVISVAWMVQFKTLLCFLFAILSMITFMKALKNKPQWFLLSWFFFLASVLSKSASLVLPLIIVIIAFKKVHGKQWLFIVPFFLISGWGGWKLHKSSITTEGISRAEEITRTQVLKSGTETNQEKIAPKEATPAKLPEALMPSDEATQKLGKPLLQLPSIKLDYPLILNTLHYYFWQVLLPLHNEPVKGHLFEGLGLEQYVHLIFLGILAFIFLKDSTLVWLLSGHILLIPFLGLIIAPYMSITWVSDQHLYLALPAFLGFWLKVVEKIPWKKSWILPCVGVLLFTFKTKEAATYYRNQLSFYEASLDFNPLNVPISYNLAFAYLMEGKRTKARETLDDIIAYAEVVPSLKENRYFPYIISFSFLLGESEENK